MLALAAAVVGCGGQTDPETPAPIMTDFSLTDVNPTSPRSGEAVSPRDYLEKISGWYFGHAT